LETLIKPFYPKKVNGRPPMPLGTMMRIHFIPQWFGYSDPAMEEALHDVPLLRRFAGLDAFKDVMPDESTILRFRHLLDKHDLAVAIFAEVNAVLSEKGLSMKRGTVVDATLIAAPSSTKNEDKKRDPEMTQTKKGNQWHFGMKAHIGVDAESGLIHTVACTTAKVADITMMASCLHGEEAIVFGDRGYHKKNRTLDDFEKEGDLSVLTPTKNYCPVKRDGESLRALNGGRFSVKKFGVDLNVKMKIRKNSGATHPEPLMNTGKTLFAQLMDFLPWTTFTRLVDQHGGDRYAKSFACTEQFRVMAFAQLTYRESLRDIEVCLSAQAAKLYHMGFRHEIKRSTLADANETRDWRIHAEFAQCLIAGAQTLHRRQLWYRVGEHGIRAGFDDHRLVPVALSVGACFAPPSRR
jgi:IS5 family transposase